MILIVTFNLIICKIYSLLITNCQENETLFKNICVPNDCLKSIEQVEAIKKPSGSRLIQSNFNGKAQMKNNNIEVEISFQEFEQPIFFRDSQLSCINDQLISHQINFYNSYLQTTEIISTKTNNLRNWKFEITNLNDTLYQDQQNTKIIYNGYYTYQFLLFDYHWFSYLMKFQVIVKNGNEELENHFEGILIDDQSSCNLQGKCIQIAQSSLKYCLNETCEETSQVGQFIYKQSYYIVQEIQEEGFDTWKIYDGEITIKSQQLVKHFKPSKELYFPGKTIYKLNIPFICGFGQIYIKSKLINTQYSFRVLENKMSGAIVVGYTDNLYCVKKNGTLCPNEEEINDFNKEDCGHIDYYFCNSTFIKFSLIMLIAFIFQ